MSNMKIELFTPEGGVKSYKLFSARLPDFLKAYPKEQGYRVQVEASDTLTSKAGLLRLYEVAIAAGKSPDQVGLPPIPAGDVVVFKATLLDKDGVALESASALRVIRQYKDWEKGETAARQRLISALGFGGDCFDEDELSDIEEQGLQVDPGKNSQPSKAPASTTSDDASAEKEDVPSQQTVSCEGDHAEQSADGAAPDSQDTASPDQPAPSMQAKQADESPEKGEVIPDRLIRQIEHQAKLKGVDVPEVGSVKEAKQALKKLMQS
jgi:hypothetical protein